MQYVEIKWDEMPIDVEKNFRRHCGLFEATVSISKFLDNMQTELKKFGGTLDPVRNIVTFNSLFHYELFLLKWT